MLDRKSIEVVAAVIRWNSTTLCVQRGESKLDYISKKWEFPGGKVEVGESHPEALRREIREELKLDIKVRDLVTTVHHRYPDFDLTMRAFDCTVECMEEPKLVLTEHLDCRWLAVDSEAFGGLDWAAADLPIVEALMVHS